MSEQIVNDYGKSPKTITYAKASAARTKGDVVYLGMGATGLVDITVADDALVHKVAVVDQDIASGAYGTYVICGECDATVPSAAYTAGHGLIMFNGVVTSTGVVFPAAAGIAGDGQTPFAVIKVGGAAVTTCTIVLHGEAFTATT